MLDFIDDLMDLVWRNKSTALLLLVTLLLATLFFYHNRSVEKRIQAANELGTRTADEFFATVESMGATRAVESIATLNAIPVETVSVPTNSAEDLAVATPEPLATPATPDREADTPVLYSVEVTSFGAALWGPQSFHIRLDLEPDPDGQPYDEAYAELTRLTYGGEDSITAVCNENGRDFSHFADGQFGRVVYSMDGRIPLSDTCLDVLESIVGSLDDYKRIPEKTLQQLQIQDMVNIGDHKIFVDVDAGMFLGYWYGEMPNPQNECFHETLTQAGWSGGEFIVLDPFNDHVSDVFWPAAYTNRDLWGPQLSDFCESGLLREVQKPAWLQMVSFPSDEVYFKVDIEGAVAQFSLHLDPATCNIYTDEWPKGRILIDLISSETEEHTPWVHIGRNDLILIAKQYGDLENMVYMAVDESGRIRWYQPEGRGPTWGAFQRIAVVEVATNVDGIIPWFNSATEIYPATAYMLENGQVVNQTVPVRFGSHEGHSH